MTRAGVEPVLGGLSAMVRGRVFRPGEAGYRAHTQVFNLRYQGVRSPRAVLVAADAEDVRRAVLWARDQGIDVVARSGGHSFAGYCVNDGLVVDLSRLSLVHADESTGLVTVGGGARLGHVYGAVRPYEMAFSAGTNPVVGVAGLALGGGCEYASRAFGLTSDALVGTTVVTADGRLLTCDERENEDLLWACRGGGGGNFGINVSFTFQARPVTDLATFDLAWRWADAAKVLDVLQHTVWQAPDEFAARLGAATSGRDPSAVRDNLLVTAMGQMFGSAAQVRAILDPVLAVADPVRQEIVERTYWEAKTSMVHSTSADAFGMRTRFVKTPLSGDGIGTLLSCVERWPGSGSPDGGGIGLFSWGGAINRIAPDATAFVHRDTMFLASMDTAWTDHDPPDLVAANLDWLDGFYEAMGRHLSASSYQNFVDPNLNGWQRAYYGANYDRLVDVKRRYDPDDVFHFDQSVGS